jgi:hypothetical protein
MLRHTCATICTVFLKNIIKRKTLNNLAAFILAKNGA